jgi:hypothetical protein
VRNAETVQQSHTVTGRRIPHLSIGSQVRLDDRVLKALQYGVGYPPAGVAIPRSAGKDLRFPEGPGERATENSLMQRLQHRIWISAGLAGTGFTTGPLGSRLARDMLRIAAHRRSPNTRVANISKRGKLE